jgi:hypothetical protein
LKNTTWRRGTILGFVVLRKWKIIPLGGVKMRSKFKIGRYNGLKIMMIRKIQDGGGLNIHILGLLIISKFPLINPQVQKN